ncbi:MAG: PLP-dependent aminotransferase family protein [Clostridiales bacterium]|nr:PLP-dependent aminotransferase family protein [Clostridiales bacterium]
MNKKYYTIYLDYKRQIEQGEFPAGGKLPAKRETCFRYGVSPVTVATAMDMLISEGYVESRPKSGYYVCKMHPLTGKKLPPSAREHLPEPEVKGEEEFSAWLKTVRKVMADRGGELFTRSPKEGCAVLRNAISDYLYRYRGMNAAPHRIIIGSGAEQLYESVVKILGRDKIFGVEDPCYQQITAVYGAEGVTLCPLTMGKEGITTSALNHQNFHVLHVTPFHSYPTGITATVGKRREYLAWAKAHNAYIVEDDFDSEFFMPGHPIETLYATDGGARVIYVNTFSKSLSASMRMGYMILPESLLSAYQTALGSYSCTVPVLEQYALAEFLNSGNFERHLNRKRRKLARSNKEE